MRANSTYNVINCLCIACGNRKNYRQNEARQLISDNYTLYYVVSGRGKVTVDGIEYQVESKQSFIAFPYSNIIIEADKTNPWDYKWVEFKGLEAAWIIGQTSLSKKNPVVDKINTEDFEKHFEIPECGRGSETYQIRAGGKLMVLLSHYLEQYPRSSTESNNYALLARNYIDKNYRNPDFNVKSVADHIKIDRTYLYRLFKEETGMSVINYINDCRIAKAEALLIDENASIKDVAYSVGFSDQMYFSKVFKKLRGITPTEYRKKNNKLF